MMETLDDGASPQRPDRPGSQEAQGVAIDPQHPYVSDVPAGPAPQAPRPDRRRRWPVPVLAVLLVLTLAGGAYLGILARAWAQRSADLEAVAVDLGTQLGQTQADLDQARSELAVVSDQLDVAHQRITELADEKAQAGDDREIQRQLADYQARVSQAATSVASALEECVHGQERLIAYLEEADAYDPADLARFESEVATFCAAATQANADLQEEIDR